MNEVRATECRLDGLTALRLILLSAILAITGCGQHLNGSLRVSEGLGTPLPEGTLILVEVITPLTREQGLGLFRAVDLHAAGLKETDVNSGTVVFVAPWAQRQTALFPAQGIYALVSPTVRSIDSGASTCTPRGCSYGGDAAAVRVVKRPAGGTGESMLYILEDIVEPRSIQGDCEYVRRGSRQALHCKSLNAKGWEWAEDIFVKRPRAKPQ